MIIIGADRVVLFRASDAKSKFSEEHESRS